MDASELISEIPSDRWSITLDGTELIVDCSIHGELGRVRADHRPKLPDDDEYGDAVELFCDHSALCALGHPDTVHYLHDGPMLVGPFATHSEAADHDPTDERFTPGLMDVRAWLFITTGLEMGKHIPGEVYDRHDPLHVAPPAEVCLECSDGARLVPVSFCPVASALTELFSQMVGRPLS